MTATGTSFAAAAIIATGTSFSSAAIIATGLFLQGMPTHYHALYINKLTHGLQQEPEHSCCQRFEQVMQVAYLTVDLQRQ